jgi:hypothetical protein
MTQNKLAIYNKIFDDKYLKKYIYKFNYNKMKKDLFYKIFNDKYLTDYIYQFDGTYKKIFKENIIYNISLKEHASDFWYNKYTNLLNYSDCNIKRLLHVQSQFLEIIFTLFNNDFTPNEHRFDRAPESNYNMLNY